MKTSYDFSRLAKKISLLATVLVIGLSSILPAQAGSGSLLLDKPVLNPASPQEKIYDHIWSRRFGASQDDYAASLSVDGSGNVFMTGAYRGSVDFGGPLVSAGGSDIFLVKFMSSGNILWSKQFGDTDDDIGYSLAVDGSGNVFVTGSFHGSVDFGSGALVSAGGADIFLAKYNAMGVHQWSMRFGALQDDSGYSLAVDGSGNVLVIGIYRGSVDFGGGVFTSAGGADIFLAKYSAGGILQWSQSFGSSQDDTGNSLAVDGFGNVFMTGAFRGSVNFGGGALASAGGSDIFLAWYDDDGIYAWSGRLGGSQDDYGFDLAVDGSGNMLVIGIYRGTIDFGSGPPVTSEGGADIFLASYNTVGITLWSKSFGSSLDDTGNSLVVDDSGNVFATGAFRGSVNFGFSTLVSAGGSDIFLAGCDTYGNLIWSKRFGGLNDDHGYSLAADGSSAILLTGDFRGSVDFGSGPLTSAGNYDIFLAKFGGSRLFIPLVSWQN
jgi:hypothetical protein